MNKELIDYYYNRFIYHFKLNNTYRFFNFNDIGDIIKKEISEVINNNYEHILTESFINFLTDNCTYFLDDLKSIYSENRSKIFDIVFFYFENIDAEYNRKRDNKDEYKDFAKLLTDEEKGIVNKAFNALDEVFGNYNEDDGWIIRCCIISNLTDCFLNNKLSSFCDICDYILDNESLILDDIKLNDLFDREDDTISERMIKIVEKGMSSKIR